MSARHVFGSDGFGAARKGELSTRDKRENDGSQTLQRQTGASSLIYSMQRALCIRRAVERITKVKTKLMKTTIAKSSPAIESVNPSLKYWRGYLSHGRLMNPRTRCGHTGRAVSDYVNEGRAATAPPAF
jgi:hypothetical protein